MNSRLSLVGAVVAIGIAASPAQAAVIATDRPCYVESAPMQIAGQQFAPNSSYSVKTDQLFAFGTADAAGSWLSTTERAPIVPERTTKPKPFTLTASQDGVEVATAQFDVVNLLVALASTRGKPTSRTTWRLSGFTPGQSIYVHVRRSKKTLANVRLGRGDTGADGSPPSSVGSRASARSACAPGAMTSTSTTSQRSAPASGRSTARASRSTGRSGSPRVQRTGR